jgi:hypothetical protein
LNVKGAGGVRQTEMHTAEPFVPEPSSSEVEVSIGKFERYINLQVLIRFQQNCFKQEGKNCIPRSINLSSSGTKENCLISGKSQLLYIFTKGVIKLTVVIIESYHSCQLHTKFYATFFSLG